MAKIHDLFIEIGNFKKRLPKAIRGKKNRQYYYAQTESSLLRIGTLLEDPEVMTILDKLLEIVHEQITKPHALQSAQELVKSEQAAFLKAENSLHPLTGLKVTDYEEVVALIGGLLPTTDIHEFPRTAKELRDHFQKTANELIQAAKNSSELPRRQKDQLKTAIGAQHWRYTVATIMTLGNVAGFLLTALPLGFVPQITGGALGVASCRYGVALFKISQSTRETHRPKRATGEKPPEDKSKGAATK